MPNEPMNLQHMTLVKYLHHRPPLVACGLALLVLLRPAPVCAQSANDGFDLAVNNRVDVAATQPDGKILIAGLFNMVGGTNRVGLARLNVDGSVDASFFAPQIFGGFAPIRAIAVQDDGKIILGGFFKTPAPFVRTNLVRLLADGSADTNFIADADNTVESLLLLPDGKILVGGYFKTVNRISPDALARLHPDGSVDTNFTTRANYGVLAMLRQPDGRVLLSGQFTALNGVPRNNMGRLNPDGSMDISFNPGAILNPSANDSVVSLALQPDGRWLAAGYFAITNQTPRRNLLRFHPDGSLDASFPVVTNTNVRRVRVQADGRILAGGSFNSFTGQTRTNLARLNLDGSLDAAFTPVARGGLGTGVSDLVLQGDGKIVVAGGFDSLAGTARTNLGRLYADGSLDATLNIGASGQPSAITPLPDGSMIVGGNFRTIGGKARSRIAKLKPDGSVDDLFVCDVVPSTVDGGFVRSVLLQTDGGIVIGGSFGDGAGAAFTNLARVHPDGSADESFSPPYTPKFSAIAIQRNGKILTGFDGGTVGPLFAPLVRRYNTDGSLDTSFSMGLQDQESYTIALRKDGRVLVGGSFGYTDGQNPTRTNLALLNTNGTLDASFTISANGPVSSVQTVNALLMQPDGSVLVGGRYERLGNYTCNGLGRVRADGTVDTNFVFAGVSGEIVGLALQADGRILVGGSFSFLGVPARINLLRLNPDGSIDATFDAGVNGMVRGLSISADGKVWIGGSFTTVAGIARTNLARLSQRDAAIQSLATDGESITWTRTGAAPEVQAVTFEQSMDGTNFAMLGYATRINNGWRLNGQPIPVGQNVFIRARGRSISGRYSGSSGLSESVAQFWRVPPPFLNNVQVLGDGQFQFSFTNTNATAFSVRASTNAAAPLAQWESFGAPVSVGGGTYQFTDPGATNHARRFYQLRSP